jgi:hypothetical protein
MQSEQTLGAAAVPQCAHAFQLFNSATALSSPCAALALTYCLASGMFFA